MARQPRCAFGRRRHPRRAVGRKRLLVALDHIVGAQRSNLSTHTCRSTGNTDSDHAGWYGSAANAANAAASALRGGDLNARAMILARQGTGSTASAEAGCGRGQKRPGQDLAVVAIARSASGEHVVDRSRRRRCPTASPSTCGLERVERVVGRRAIDPKRGPSSIGKTAPSPQPQLDLAQLSFATVASLPAG